MDGGEFEDGESAGLAPIGELLGKAKRNASGGASEIKGAVNPRKYTRSPEAAASFARKRAETAARKRSERGEAEPILEVKGAPEPEAPAPQPTKKDIEGWGGMIYLGHALMAGMLSVPELGIDRNEAQELSVASMNVMRHYGSAILSEKTQDWIKLAMVMGSVYVPRMAKANSRVRAAKAAKNAAGPQPGRNDLGGFERPADPIESELPLEEMGV